MPWPWKRQLKAEKTREDKQREQIERVAYELYQNRLLLKRSGDCAERAKDYYVNEQRKVTWEAQ